MSFAFVSPSSSPSVSLPFRRCPRDRGRPKDHPDLEFLFSVESRDDPAYSFVENTLAEVRKRQPDLEARLIVAGISFERAQNITNQLAAIDGVRSNIVHLVFLDSDARPDRKYVRYLVNPLRDSRVGATTGYRWYHPARPSFSGMLCSVWNAGALPTVVHPSMNFVWGGAMAISLETFVRAEVRRAWGHVVSNDLALTQAVKRQGLEVRYIPECISITYESPSLADTLEFTSRQMLMMRVYHPCVWWVNSIVHLVFVGLISWGFVSLMLLISTGSEVYLSGVGGLALLPFFFAAAYRMLEACHPWMPEISRSIYERRWYYVLLAPVASFLSTHNSIRNLLTRKILWRGIQYELISPEQIIVTRPDAS